MEKGWCVWITGLPGSGKSTVAELLVKKVRSSGGNAQTVSIDMIRKYATPQPTYTEEERVVVYGALVFTAKMLTENHVNVVIDATGNRRKFRAQARRVIPRFIEAYLECPLEVCIRREAERKDTHLAPADIYARAKEGRSPTVPGVGVPYESPISPEVKIDSSKFSAEETAQKILITLKKHFNPSERDTS